MSVMDRILAEFEASVKTFPNVPYGAADPYSPSRGGR
jgi:hypothetical protein